MLLDVHSYNHRRDGVDAEPEPAEDNPDVNVGTGTLDRELRALVDASWRAREESVGGESLDVRENVRFQGRAVSWWVHDRYPDLGCCLALEFKKTFMDEWTREVDDERLARRVRALARHRPGARRALARLR